MIDKLWVHPTAISLRLNLKNMR